MKYPYKHISKLLHYKWQKWNSNKFKSKTRGKKKSKHTRHDWAGDQKLSSEIHFYPKYTYNYLVSFSARTSTCGSKRDGPRREMEGEHASPTPTPCLYVLRNSSEMAHLCQGRSKTACLPVLSSENTELEREYSTWQTRRKERYSV